MKDVYKLTIPGELPVLNEIIKASKRGKGKWQPYAEMKKEYTEKVAILAKVDVNKSFKKIDILIRWVCKNRRKDKDGITAGTKFILDGLVLAGVIKDDGWRQVGDIFHMFDVDRKDPRVEVYIQPGGLN